MIPQKWAGVRSLRQPGKHVSTGWSPTGLGSCGREFSPYGFASPGFPGFAFIQSGSINPILGFYVTYAMPGPRIT